MSRLALIAALALLVWLGLSRLRRSLGWGTPPGSGRPPTRGGGGRPAAAMQLRRCPVCGVHYPARKGSGSPETCSEECSRRASEGP